MSSSLTAGQHALLEAGLVRRLHQLNRQLAEQFSGDSRAEHATEVLRQDADDRARHADLREVDLARTDKDLQELGAVCEGLRRLRGSGYGTCVDCDATIAFDRLELEPWALRCVACETAHEAAPGGARRARASKPGPSSNLRR